MKFRNIFPRVLRLEDETLVLRNKNLVPLELQIRTRQDVIVSGWSIPQADRGTRWLVWAARLSILVCERPRECGYIYPRGVWADRATNSKICVLFFNFNRVFKKWGGIRKRGGYRHAYCVACIFVEFLNLLLITLFTFQWWNVADTALKVPDFFYCVLLLPSWFILKKLARIYLILSRGGSDGWRWAKWCACPFCNGFVCSLKAWNIVNSPVLS